MEGKVSTQVFITNGTIIIFVCVWVCVCVGIIYPPFVHKCPLREQLGHAAALCSEQEGISLQSTRCVCSHVWSFSYNGSHVVCSLVQLVAEGTLSTSAFRYGLYGRGTAVSRGRASYCRNTVALHCTRLVQKLAEIYAGLPTFREIFQATASNLER